MLQSKMIMILIAVLVLTMGFAGCERQRVGKLQTQLKAANDTVNGLTIAVDSKDHVIAKFIAANKMLMDAANDHEKAMEAAKVASSTLEKELEEARKKSQLKESADLKLPDCDKLLRMDLNICPAHAATIRGR